MTPLNNRLLACMTAYVSSARSIQGGIRVIGLLAVLTVFLAHLPSVAQAQSKPRVIVPLTEGPTPTEICTYRPVEIDRPVFRGGRSAKADGDPTAVFIVEYGEGFTSEARAAFQRAVDTWAVHIQSSVPIRIDARFEQLGENVLGSAGPTTLFGFDEGDEDAIPGEPINFKAVALAEAIAGEQLNEPDAADIIARFSSQFAAWHFDTSPPPSNRIDFETVVLHEIGHGLGFFGSMSVDDGDPNNGDECEGVAGQGCYGFLTNEATPRIIPLAYDLFAEDADTRRLLNTDIFGNPSSELGAVLTGNGLFFDGARTNDAVALDDRFESAKIYAPSSWSPGSSYSHVDEVAYPAGDFNALMSPTVGAGEGLRVPGSIVCSIFADSGWPLGPGCMTGASAIPEAVLADIANPIRTELASDGNLVLTWRTQREVNIERFIVQRRLFDGSFQRVAIAPGAGAGTSLDQSYSVTLFDVPEGTQTYRLLREGADGITEVLATTQVGTPIAGEFKLTAAPNPFQRVLRIELEVATEQDVQIRLYDTLGRVVASLFNDAVSEAELVRLEVRADRLASGMYFLQVQGETFSESEQIVVLK